MRLNGCVKIVDRLSGVVAARSARGADGAPRESAVGVKLDAVLGRIAVLEQSLVAQSEGAAVEARQRLKEQFRSEEGATLAEELFAQRKFAVGANGILTFLDAHPNHPDEQDLMRRARDGFRDSGYLDKALWLQKEIMQKFPEHRAGDLYLIARLERRMKRFDDALEHIDRGGGTGSR